MSRVDRVTYLPDFFVGRGTQGSVVLAMRARTDWKR